MFFNDSYDSYDFYNFYDSYDSYVLFCVHANVHLYVAN